MSEIIFQIEEAPDGRVHRTDARIMPSSLKASSSTTARQLPRRGALPFRLDTAPKMIRRHFVFDEVLAA